MYAVKANKKKSVDFLTAQKSNDLNEEDNDCQTILMITMSQND